MSKKKKNHKKNHNPRKNTSQKKTGVEFFLSEVSTNYISDDIRKDRNNWLEVLVDECTYELGSNIKLPITEPYAYELFDMYETETTKKVDSDFCFALLALSKTVRLFCHRNGKRYFTTELDWDTVISLFKLAYERNGLPFSAVSLNQDA